MQAEEGRELDSAHSVLCSLGGLGTGWSIKGTESDRGWGETGLSDKIQGAQLNLKFKQTTINSGQLILKYHLLFL